MLLTRNIDVVRVEDEASRQAALEVMRAIYRDEKNWVQDDRKLVPPEDLSSSTVSWFVARNATGPLGVLRVLYEPPIDLYKQYGFKIVVEGLDLNAFLKGKRIAEIGRFAVVPSARKNILVAGALMRAASRETVSRNFTHYITDVFEGEEHSPYDFHTRVMGFKTVATHDVGELNCPNRRITMILDLREGYQRLKKGQSWIFRYLTAGWDERLHQQLSAPGELTPINA